MSSDLLKEFGNLKGKRTDEAQREEGRVDNDVEAEEFGEFQEPETQDRTSGHRIKPPEKPGRYSHDVGVADSEAPHAYHSADRPKAAQKSYNHTPQKRSAPKSNASQNECRTSGDGLVLFDADTVLPFHQQAPTKRAEGNASLRGPEVDTDDPFDVWEPEDTPQSMVAPGPPTQRIISSAHTTLIHSSKSVKPFAMGPPPTNIPPPSVLLSLSANLLYSVPSKIKETLTTDNEDLDQARIDQFQHLVSTLYAIAHILSGRKLRWKRDNLLSQNMKIGPAGKRAGMKLMGIDKTESRREDQEAGEVLKAWKQQVGPLRSTLAMANLHLPGRCTRMPEIAENMPVRAGRSDEGALTAVKACFLCGLKRDERVFKVDVDVQDSFGEWWTEHWGHFDCVKFWSDHEFQLAQR
ncbi:MAG: hypothetical protein Q9163_005393 [Psora crenata]